MKGWIIFILVLIIALDSCIDRNKNEQPIAEKSGIHQKPPTNFTDTLRVDYVAAVFFQPDSLQNEKIKSITDPAIFESLEHDCQFQLRYSRIALQKHWPAIKIVDAKNYRYIFFIAPKTGMSECIDLNRVNDACGVFLFDTRKKPKLVDMTNIDSELGFYFGKQGFRANVPTDENHVSH